MLERVCRKGNSLVLLGGMLINTANYEEQYCGSSKTKNKTITWCSNPTTGHILCENRNAKRHIHPSVHCSTIYNRTWKQPKYPLMDEWIKMWYIYIIEYYSAIKRNNIGSIVEIGMNLESVIQNEIESEREKQILCIICMWVEGWAWKNWCFWFVVLEKTLAIPSESKQIKPVNPKGNQPWIFIGRTGCWSWSSNTLTTWCKEPAHWKRPGCWERLRAIGEGDDEDEVVRWHHRLNRHEFEQTLGDSEGQRNSVCCSSWGHKELDTT